MYNVYGLLTIVWISSIQKIGRRLHLSKTRMSEFMDQGSTMPFYIAIIAGAVYVFIQVGALYCLLYKYHIYYVIFYIYWYYGEFYNLIRSDRLDIILSSSRSILSWAFDQNILSTFDTTTNHLPPHKGGCTGIFPRKKKQKNQNQKRQNKDRDQRDEKMTEIYDKKD